MKIDRFWKFGKCFQIAFCLCVTVFSLTGCAIHQKNPPETLAQKAELSPKEIIDKYDQNLARPSRPISELSPIVPLEPQMATETTFPYETVLFSIDVIDEPLGNVLMGLAKAADLNLILGQDVDRLEPVSVKIKNMPLVTALETIISMHDYDYVIEKNILRVEGLKTQFFAIDYPIVYSNPRSETGGDILGGGGSGSGGESATAISGSGLKGEFTIKVEVQDEDELDVWKKIEDALKPSKQGEAGMLSEQGKANINRMAGSIVVTDRPKNLRTVAQFVENVNRALQRQVMIEAKIVEVTLGVGHSYGIDWEMVKRSVDPGGGLRTLAFSSIGGALTTGFIDTDGEVQGQVVLNALATQGDVNVLSSPRLNVVNNQSALISVGRVIPYLDLTITTSEDEDNQGNRFLRTSSQPIIARTLEGVTLGITAQISEDGVTTLHIVPIITEQTGSKTLVVQDENFDVPIFSVRESDTMVTVAHQQTIVIGGLIQEKTDDRIQKIPLLGDIPFLKVLFSYQQRDNRKTELIILLTTTIVNS